jgi:hypothetical protein
MHLTRAFIQETPGMNPGHSVQDANTGLPPRPSGQDDVGRYAQKAVPQKAVQDIQDIIDKLAAVTQQLRHPHRN